MNGPIQIRRPEVVRNLRELAILKGKSVTDTVAEAVDGELRRLRTRAEAEVEARRAAVKATVARIQALPVVGPMPTDHDLYDPDGLPKESSR